MVENVSELYEKLKNGKNQIQEMSTKSKFILKNTQKEVQELRNEIEVIRVRTERRLQQ